METRAFKVIDIQSGKTLDNKSYEFASTHDYYLPKLRKQYEKGNILIQCSCSNAIEMKIANAKRPYLYQAKRGESHSKDCYKHKDFVTTVPYEKVWKFDEAKQEYIVQLDSLMPIMVNQEAPPIFEDDPEKRKAKRIYTDSGKEGKATIFGLASKMNLMAWEGIVNAENPKMPDDKYELSKKVFGLSNRIRLANKRHSLNEMYYKRKNIREIKVGKDIFFVYMYLQNVDAGDDLFHDGTSLEKIACQDSFKNLNYFYVDRQEFQNKMKNEPHSSEYVVAGFVYKKNLYHKCLSFGNYCLIPITKQGLFVESSNEKGIYEELYHQQKRFIKPYSPVEGYGNFIPDYIVYEDGEKPIIGEVFGIKGSDSYDLRMAEKIALSQTKEFQSQYRFEQHNFK